MLKTKDDVLNEVRSQLLRFLISGSHSIDWLEVESKHESEYPIAELATHIGYNSTADLLHAEFREHVRFLGENIITAGPQLYNTPELEHIVSLHKRTKDANVLKQRNKPEKRNYESVQRFEIRRPSRHVYGNENAPVVIRRRIRIIEKPYYRGGRIQKKEFRPKPSARDLPTNRFRQDCRKTLTTDLMDNILELSRKYGYGKPNGRLTSLHLETLSVPPIAFWDYMLKRISNITARHAKVTLINDVCPMSLFYEKFFEELHRKFRIKNKYGETFFDEESKKLYSVFSGTLKTRRYKILFLIGR